MSLSYCPFYCEENAILAAQSLAARGFECNIVFVSNALKRVPLWRMRNGNKAMNGAIAFDYHVLCVARLPDQPADRAWRVVDLDFDDDGVSADADGLVAFETYCERALLRVRAQYAREFRVVSLAEIEREFRSDRSHMRDKERPDEWLAAPPQWPVLFDATTSNLFERFVDMRASDGVGVVLTQEEFEHRFEARENGEDAGH
jgi:hypothetical protein